MFTSRASFPWPAASLLLLGLLGLIAPPSWGAVPATRPVGLRIALVSDPHVGDGPQERAYVRHFRAVIDQVNAAAVDAVLISGDLTQSGKVELMPLFTELARTFRAPVVRFVPGNHDVGNKPIVDQKTSLNEARLKSYEDHVGPLFFTADLAPDVRVVGITSSLLGSGLREEQEQWTFLERELRTGHDADTNVLVLSHYPPFIRTPDEADDYFNMNHGPRERLLQLLHDAGVRTLLSGHLHRPIDVHDGSLHIVGAPAVSFGLPAGPQREGWTLVTLDPAGDAKAELHYLPHDPTTRPASAAAPAR